MNLVKVKCAFCGKEFLRRKGQFKEAKKIGWKQYCSWKCLSRDKIKRQVLVCENCGKRFERKVSGISPHNYCSHSCAAIVNNKKCPKRQAKLKVCANNKCNKQFRGSSKERARFLLAPGIKLFLLRDSTQIVRTINVCINA